MGLVRRIFGLLKRDANNATVAPAPRLGAVDLFASTGNAMNIATVYRCVKVISESIANLPLRYMRDKGGVFVEDTANRLHYLLRVQPDDCYSSFDLLRLLVSNVLLDGNAYVVPVYFPGTPELDRLVLCTRGSVSHDTSTDTYTVSDFTNGLFGTFAEGEIIHVKGLPGNNPKQGMSVLSHARMTTAIAAAGDRETRNRFESGGNVSGIVSNGANVAGFGQYADEQLKRLAQNLTEKFSTGDRIVSLPGQVDFKQLSLSSTDMQFLGSRQFTVREICRFFGVPPMFVYDDTNNNYKSVEMANVAFRTNTLDPLMRSIECEFNRKLIAPALCCKRRFQFDRRDLSACDLDSRMRYITQSIAAGLYTVNDWRKIENLPPVDGGDAVLVSANLRGISELTDPGAGDDTAPHADNGTETNTQEQS